MRISDWSSDVCSSDLQIGVEPIEHRLAEARWNFGRLDIELGATRIAFAAQRIDQRFQFRQTRRIGAEERILVDARLVDRKSVVSGKSVSVRLDIGGHRVITTKQQYK